MPKILTQDVVENWIGLTSGTFHKSEIWSELGIQTPENKTHLRVILTRLEEKKLIVKVERGLYRRLDETLKPVEWQSADPNKVVPILLPFGIHEHCRIYPKSIIILAGEKNEGKTAFLYDTIRLNMEWAQIDLFNSETGPEQMKERFAPLGIPELAPFNVFERYDNFADVIHPEHLTVIDYLDTNSEVYMVGVEINSIFKKLTTGVAVIGLQKPPPSVTYVKGVKKVISRDLAYGGAFTAKRACLYISLGSHKLKLVYVKTPGDKKVNPNNMMWTYDFNENGYFTNIERYYEGEKEDWSKKYF